MKTSEQNYSIISIDKKYIISPSKMVLSEPQAVRAQLISQLFSCGISITFNTSVHTETLHYMGSSEYDSQLLKISNEQGSTIAYVSSFLETEYLEICDKRYGPTVTCTEASRQKIRQYYRNRGVKGIIATGTSLLCDYLILLDLKGLCSQIDPLNVLSLHSRKSMVPILPDVEFITSQSKGTIRSTTVYTHIIRH